jgi:hypothetical protein
MDEDLTPPFTPVPLDRVRANGWTPRRQRDFIAALAITGVVARAAKAVGMTRQSAQKLRDRPGAESFADAWDIAMMIGYDRNYEAVLDRARNGIARPVMYKGKQIGIRYTPDYRLALAALDSHPPMPRNKVTR